MPSYRYRCNDCQARFALVFSYEEYDRATPACPRCGSHSLRRRIGRIALARGEESRFDDTADDDLLSGLDEEDPRSLGRFMRRMSHEMGEDLGDEFGEVVDRLEKGQSPEDIEAAMPDLGADAGDGLDLD